MKLKLPKWIRSCGGNFTIEASLVFPIILCMLLLMMFFCMYLYQGVVLGQVAIVAAERTAYSWDNSYREARTGKYEDGKHDSLYWRLSDDGMLEGIFGWSQFNSSSAVRSIQLPTGEIMDRSLPLKKLSITGVELPPGMSGVMEYNNKLLLRQVNVSLERHKPLLPLERVIGDVTQRTEAKSYVVDPVEWIRTVDLIRYYGARFRGSGAEGDQMDQQEAGEALKMFGK
ncbi:hypothetical protein D3C76_120110 [compost metagenome]